MVNEEDRRTNKESATIHTNPLGVPHFRADWLLRLIRMPSSLRMVLPVLGEQLMLGLALHDYCNG
jgi:hypothetical protein